MKPNKISVVEFRAMLEDPEVPDERIAAYLKTAKGPKSGLNPVFGPDPELVEPDRFEDALTIGNWWCRRRRRARFERRVAAGEDLPVILSEGDSWFQFPFIIKDVIDHLDRDYLVWSCGAAGDTAQNIIFDNPEYMAALDEQADRVTAFLLSAAGNDVIGEDASGKPVLSGLLHKKGGGRDTAYELVNKAALARVTDKLRDAYLKVIATVRADTRFHALPIILHGYDYALPHPVGPADPRNPYWAADDEWLGAPMREKQIHEPALQQAIVEMLIQSLHDMLREVAESDPHVHLVDLRGTLTKVTDWADEIHGTSDGFAKVAAKFRSVLRRVIVPRAAPLRVEAAPAELPPVDGFPPIQGLDELLIASRGDEPVEPGALGLGDVDRFARGFRRTKSRISRAAVPEVAIGEDDSVPYRFLGQGFETGKAVCRIEASGVNFRGRSDRWSGTGFLVAPNILLTNHHVLNSADVAARSAAVFNFQEDGPGVMAPSERFSLDPDRLFIASPFTELDYAFVWVNGTPQERFGTIPFWRGSFMAPPGAPANIIHHPGGMPKRASLEKNEVINLGLEAVLVHYTSDTEPGSSGSPVMTDEWRLFALHHASSGHLPEDLRQRVTDAGYTSNVLNEGIKTSAIAIDVDRRADRGPDRAMARQVQAQIAGSDSRTGFFGSLGRPARGRDGFEVVVDTYRGAPTDIDVAFWNVEWFNRDYHRKVDDVARIVADLNLDIWALQETSLQATEALVSVLRHEFDLDFGFAASEPSASGGKQTTTVIWNRRTVTGRRLDWAPEIDEILKLRSDDPEAARFEAVEGKIFNRYPGLFRFEALHRSAGMAPFDFNLVPVHLKARGEGAKRRRMASKVLATAVAMAGETSAAENDWVIGGDFNAELSTGQFDALSGAGFTPMSAADERGGAITYLGRRFRSLIDSIFLSPDLTRLTDENDFMIIAADRGHPGFVDRVSDHRPVMIRLSLADQANGDAGGRDAGGGNGPEGDVQALYEQFLRELRGDPPGVLRDIAEILSRR